MKILLYAIGAVLVWLFARRYFIKVESPILKAAKGVKLVDPCPGNNQIWDADLGKCIPFDFN